MMQLYDSDIVKAADTLRKAAKISQVDHGATIWPSNVTNVISQA